MAVRIRLQRKGRKKRPFYRVVVADSRSTRDGRFIEKLGYYNPLTDPIELVINEERALNWLHNGAQPSDTAKSLLSKLGILQRFHEQKLANRIAQLADAEEASKPAEEASKPAEEASTAEAGEASTAEAVDAASEEAS